MIGFLLCPILLMEHGWLMRTMKNRKTNRENGLELCTAHSDCQNIMPVFIFVSQSEGKVVGPIGAFSQELDSLTVSS